MLQYMSYELFFRKTLMQVFSSPDLRCDVVDSYANPCDSTEILRKCRLNQHCLRTGLQKEICWKEMPGSISFQLQ